MDEKKVVNLDFPQNNCATCIRCMRQLITMFLQRIVPLAAVSSVWPAFIQCQVKQDRDCAGMTSPASYSDTVTFTLRGVRCNDG